MRKYDDGLCSLQEHNQFKIRIFDAINEWSDVYNSDPEMGIALEQSTLDVEVCRKEDAQEREWIPMEALGPDGDRVLDLVDGICFVR